MDWKNKGWQLFPTRCSLRPVEHHWFRPQKFMQTRGLSQISSDLAGSIDHDSICQQVITGVQCIFFVFPMWVWDLQGLEISAACTMASSNSRLSPTCIRHRGNFSTSWNAKTDTSRYTVSKVILMMLRLVMFLPCFWSSLPLEVLKVCAIQTIAKHVGSILDI